MFKFIIIVLITSIFLTGCSLNTNNNNNNNTTNEVKISTNENTTNYITETPKPIEEEISSYSTKIYTKEEGRQTNIGLTCSTLNDKIVNNGDTFSFTNTVGKATSDKGYKKADTFDANGNTVKALGGGNCQISSTLYNAILAVDGLTITERHSHSNKVLYVPKGKDAAVAYGSVDLKFRNDTGYNIKIKAENTPDEVIIKILKISLV